MRNSPNVVLSSHVLTPKRTQNIFYFKHCTLSNNAPMSHFNMQDCTLPGCLLMKRLPCKGKHRTTLALEWTGIKNNILQFFSELCFFHYFMFSLLWLNVSARGGQHCIACLINLQESSHEYRASHEQENDQAGEPLFSDAQEARLLSRSRALGLQLQAVNVRDRQDGGRYEPGQAHNGAHRQHHPDHQQVQVVPTALLYKRGQKSTCDTYSLQLKSTAQKCGFN